MANFEQTYALAPGGRVEIEQRNGNVRVVAWDRPEVRLKATSNEDVPLEERVRVAASSHSVEIEVRGSDNWFVFGRRPQIDLELSVPTGTRLEIESGSGDVILEGTMAPVTVETGSGDIVLTGVSTVTAEAGSGDIRLHQIHGPVRLETGSGNATLNEVHGSVELEVGSGDVSLRSIYGNVQAESGSGNLTVADVVGRVELESGSGDIAARQVSGPSLHVSTGSGSLQLDQLDVQRLETESGNGDIRAELAVVHPGGHYVVHSSAGDVTVALPPDAGMRVRVSGGSGRIRYDGLNLLSVYRDGGELEATLNNGGAALEIENGSGNVTLRPYAGPGPAVQPPQKESFLVQAIRQDKALESSEPIQRVLLMVQEGKLSPEEAEQLLSELDEEEEVISS